MALIFETASPTPASTPARADVACFIGFVARRTASAPADPPVAVESWEAFEARFDWAARPVKAGADTPRCATWLGAAVRGFFAAGGRRAWIVRCGDPWPLLPEDAVDEATRTLRLQALLGNAQPFNPLAPATWTGLGQLFGLEEASLLCLPDLPDIQAAPPLPATLPPQALPVSEHFVECSPEAEAPQALPLPRQLQAPALDEEALRRWAASVGEVTAFLSRWRRDCLFIGALPLCRMDAADAARRAQLDPLAWFDAAALPAAEGAPPRDARSAFVQLGWPWLRTRAGADLPQGLEPPDGTLAGLLAAHALERGCYRSAAGRRAGAVFGAEPMPAWGGGAGSPWERLARQVCVFAPGPEGWALRSDVTTSRDLAWRAGAASRLMGSVLRAARGVGQEQLFDANGPAAWAAVRRAMESLLGGYWRAGGLRGATADEAFSVRCGPQTLTQADLDAGRLRVEVVLQPAASIERITVVLALGDAARGTAPAPELA